MLDVEKQGPAEASNGSDLDAIIHQCMQTSPKRAGRAELHVIVRDMRRLKVELQLYPLGTADGALTHFLIIMDEVPMCPALPHPGVFEKARECTIFRYSV